jgi:hypothetical protein
VNQKSEHTQAKTFVSHDGNLWLFFGADEREILATMFGKVADIRDLNRDLRQVKLQPPER